MNKFMQRAAVGAATTTLLLALGATPGGAGAPAVQATGDFECQSDGTYLLSYTITNNIGDDLTVENAEISGAVDPTPVSVAPNPIPQNSDGTAAISVPGNTTGQVDFTFDWFWGDGEGNESFPLQLAGDCVAAPTTTTTSTTVAPTTDTTEAPTTTTEPEAAPPAQPVAVAPTFTG